MACDCGNPECMGPLDFDFVDQAIEKHGHAVVTVLEGPDEGDYPFSYTIGLSLKGLPELILVCPSPPEDMASLINSVSVAMGDDPTPRVLDLGGKFPVRIVEVENAEVVRDDWTVQAGEYLENQDYKVVQIQITDMNGKFPGEEGFNEDYHWVTL